jgi:hypothetical protein
MRRNWQLQFACFAAATAILAGPVGAQERSTSDVHGIAHQLLKIFYPSLARQGLYFAVKGADAVPFDGLPGPLMHFAVAVIKPVDPFWFGVANEKIPAGHERREILSGFFDFDFNGVLVRWFANGQNEFLNQARRDQLAKQIGGANDSQLDEILAAANLKFGAESETQLLTLVRPLINRLELWIGKSSIIKTDFSKRDPRWIVGLKVLSSAGPLFYNLQYEPFEGKLIFIDRGSK